MSINVQLFNLYQSEWHTQTNITLEQHIL